MTAMPPVQETFQESETSQTIAADVIFPPGDLYSNEPPLETELHLRQILLFLTCLEWLWRHRHDFYAAGNLTIYYSPHQRKSEDFRGPDFFVVLGTQRKTRKSWVVWEEEGKYPNVIVEVLSSATAKTDKTTKKEIYQDTFRTPDYFLFDPEKVELVGFHLVEGKYEDLEANDRGHLWSQQLGLYLGIENQFVRFFTPDGQRVPTPEEEAEFQRQKNERLAAKLRELGIDPDTID